MLNDIDALPNLPQRLKQLRLELGWTLEDVARITGVTQRGVASNWEATNQRRRTPPLHTLLVLQRWYGVSMDYLLAIPDAERDSPAVRKGKRRLREQLSQTEVPLVTSPSDRARMVVAMAMEVAPDAFFVERFAANLTQSTEDMDHLMVRGVWADPLIDRLATMVGITQDWFYAVEPAEVLNAAE
jgi:transcriptional regulator with XRE-family HTH domain